MRRMNYSRPARVAKVSGRRVGAKGRPQLSRERDERKLDLEIERSWNESGWILTKQIKATDASFTLTPKPKTSQVAIAVGDWLRFIWKDSYEEVVVSKISAGKVTTYHVERAIHKTRPAAWTTLSTIYINK